MNYLTLKNVAIFIGVIVLMIMLYQIVKWLVIPAIIVLIIVFVIRYFKSK